MRQFSRYAVDIPIEITVRDSGDRKTEQVKDVGIAGLCITMTECPDRGSRLLVRIPYLNPPFQTVAVVVWCLHKGENYDVGLCLLDPDDAFNVRMVEQVCYIEHYRNEVLRAEGRRLNAEEAAAEWISAYSSNFPGIKPGRSHTRRFIRHPTDIRIETRLLGPNRVFVEDARDIGLGGLRLSLPACPEIGAEIDVCVLYVEPPFETTGKVAWRNCSKDRCDVGIKLNAWQEQGWLNVLEQICNIEQYKQKLRRETGRQLSTAQAADELQAQKKNGPKTNTRNHRIL